MLTEKWDDFLVNIFYIYQHVYLWNILNVRNMVSSVCLEHFCAVSAVMFDPHLQDRGYLC